MRYLSDDWLAALDEALRSDDSLRAAASDADLVVDQAVVADGGAEVRYQIAFRSGKVSVRPGTPDRADVRLTTDATTARAIARGELAAQEAFLHGRLRVGGDVSALLAHRELFAAVGDAAKDLRDRTEW